MHCTQLLPQYKWNDFSKRQPQMRSSMISSCGRVPFNCSAVSCTAATSSGSPCNAKKPEQLRVCRRPLHKRCARLRCVPHDREVLQLLGGCQCAAAVLKAAPGRTQLSQAAAPGAPGQAVQASGVADIEPLQVGQPGQRRQLAANWRVEAQAGELRERLQRSVEG